jgi:phosphatidylglycerol:prolipoprotein diacylglycerol transferase
MHAIPFAYLGIHRYGLFLVFALGCGWWLARRRAAKIGIPRWHIDWLAPLLLVGIALGSKLGGAVSQLLTHDRANDRVLYGALLMAVGVAVAYGLLTRISPGRLLDAFAFSFLVGVAVLRVGCFQAGCCWGDICARPERLAVVDDSDWLRQVRTIPALCGRDWPLRVTYAAGSPAHRQQAAAGVSAGDAQRSLPVHPVQLYETVAVLLFLGFLAFVDPKLQRWGESFALSVLGYSVIRFHIEWFRADNLLVVGSLTLPQLAGMLCAGVCVAALVLRIWLVEHGHSRLYRRTRDK